MTSLARLLAVRAGEGRLIVLVSALFATIEAARGFGEIGADTLLLSRIGPEALPYLYVALGLTSLVVAVGYGAAVGRFSRGRFLVTVLAGFGLILIVQRGAVASGANLAFPIQWLIVYVIGAILATLLWTVAGSVLDARQAKRLFPIFTAAAIVGGFAGTLLAGPFAKVAGAENLVLIDAALLILGAGLAATIARGLGGWTRLRRERASVAADLKAGNDYVRASPLMRLVASAYVLFAILLFSVSFPFLRTMSEAFASEADLATALGILAAAVTGVSFLISIGIANRLYARLGVATVAMSLPLVYLGGFVVWLVSFNFVTAIGFRFAQQVTQRGISNAAWNAFYNVVPVERRAQVLAFNDGVPGQLGTALSGVLLLLATGLIGLPQVFVIGTATALLCIWVVVQIRRRYAESIIRTLRAGLAEQLIEGGPGLAALTRDVRLTDEVRVGLKDRSPGVRRLAAEIVGQLGLRDAIGDLLGLLDDPDPSVRRVAIDTVARIGPDQSSVQPLLAALEDVDAQVRAAAVRAVAASSTDPMVMDAIDRRAADPNPFVLAEVGVVLADRGDIRSGGILHDLVNGSTVGERLAALGVSGRSSGRVSFDDLVRLLADPAPEVRAAAVIALIPETDRVDDAAVVLIEALDDDSGVVRLAARQTLHGYGDDVARTLVEALPTRSGQAQELVLAALDGHAAAVEGPLVAWALDQVERATHLRRSASGLDGGHGLNGSVRGSSTEFLRFTLEQRASKIEDRLAAAVGLLGGHEIQGLLRRSLRSDDPQTRGQAIEALDNLGDRRLRRAVVGLLEREASVGRAGLHDTVQALIGDPDPWIRALAARVLVEIENDRRPPFNGGLSMPETRDTLDTMERMLFLRRVPLFAQLAPEDLQRMATAAIERLYPAGEVIVQEGDPGDELVVIVDGRVRVVRGEGQDARPIRSYGPGDHIGELALLRASPRAATVVADAPEVRALVIGGEGLKAILRERPEAAMAMLATLAERISEQ